MSEAFITPEGKVAIPEAAMQYAELLGKEMDRLVALYGFTGGEVAAGAIIYAATINKLNAKPGHEQSSLEFGTYLFTLASTGRREKVN